MKKDIDGQDEVICQEPQTLDNDNEIMGDATNRRLLHEYAYIRKKQENAAPNIDEAWTRFNKRILEPEKQRKAKHRTNTLWIIRGVAAAVVVCAVVTAFFLFKYGNNDINHDKTPLEYAEYIINDEGNIVAIEAVNGPNVVMIGNDEESLKPIDKIDNDCRINTDKNKAVVKSMPMANIMNTAKKTITTPRGAMYEIVLSDGTKVKLNTDSKLVFPVQFSGDERVVELNGEAYFDVAHDESHPFIVKSQQITTTVLGTKFDIKSYEDVSATVTLIEGAVKVENNSKPEDNVTLSPNQNVILTKNGQLSINYVEASHSIKWTEDLFYFNQTPMMMAMKDMGRWYNVNIEITDEMLKFYPVSFEISRKCGIAEFIDKLNDLDFLDVKYTNEVVYINKKENSNMPALKILPNNSKDNNK